MKFANLIAKNMNINTPDFQLLKLSSKGSTFLSKRFDRDKNIRYPFVSMMTILMAKDGDSSSYSYIDLISAINTYSSCPKEDCVELFKRLVLNVLLHNGDDHLRNHGFIYKDKKWRLSPVYDINPGFDSSSLTLSIDGICFDFDMDKVIKTSKYYGINIDECNKIIKSAYGAVNSLKPNKEITIKDINLIKDLII